MDWIDYPHWSHVPPRAWPWPNFTPPELASRGNGAIRLQRAALDTLQTLRDALGQPMHITSAYRDPIHNRRVGGARFSRHTLGQAFDISLAHQDRERLRALARNAGFTGFGLYQTFLHLDTGPSRRWFGQNAKELWS